ncbi:MAG: glycosyltransferase family 4 protein [Amylibacter sp.]|nr:glycosyltransferase family 4 protein [Amylibacter sp.]
MTKAPTLAVVVKGWPRLSETFIAQELLALQDKGLQFEIWSLRFPTDKKTHPLHQKITASVKYLPEYLHQEPKRVWRAWRTARKLPGFKAAYAMWRKDFARDKTRNRIRRFGQACVLATELPQSISGLYAHFMHTPSSVARYAAIMRGMDWGFSAHAKDIWTSPEWEKREKLNPTTHGAAFGVTCTAYGAQHLRGLADTPKRIDLVYHGLDLSRFPAPPDRPVKAPNAALQFLSVGRLVQKKGFDRLITALAILPKDMQWHWVHIGGGDLKDTLQEQAKKAGVADRITWRGACNQPEVITAMQSADIFILPSRIADDGDRDGLPNVLMEAASQKLPIISTDVSAIPEFIDTGSHGLLVQDDPTELAAAIIDMALHPEKRAGFADAAFMRLTTDFGMDAGITKLTARLQTLCAKR